MSRWTHPIPVWVSRKTADGFIANFTVPLWLFFVLGVIVLLNVILWSVIGLGAAILLLVGLL